jgi:phosphoribosyl 1,2-cyclic phosphodiesterase
MADGRERKPTSKESEAILKIKIWGARGSLPAPLSPTALQKDIRELFVDFVESREKNSKIIPDIDKFLAKTPRYKLGGYGGHTPCVEVQSSSHRIIIDGGSGIRPLGAELMKGPCGQAEGEVDILFTHFHWDHLIGLPFFIPIFIPNNIINVYAVQPDLEEVFQTLFKKPYFPVPLEKLGAKIVYHRLEPRKPKKFGDMTVTPYQLDHPDPCWGFKIEKNGHVFSHCVDTECTRVSQKELGEDLPLYQGVDTMFFDAQYPLMESIEKLNWGHAAASVGLDIAMREGIRRVVFMHHDPASTNEKIAAAEKQARRYYENQLKHARKMKSLLHEVEWEFGYDGMVLEV